MKKKILLPIGSIVLIVVAVFGISIHKKSNEMRAKINIENVINSSRGYIGIVEDALLRDKELLGDITNEDNIVEKALQKFTDLSANLKYKVNTSGGDYKVQISKEGFFFIQADEYELFIIWYPEIKDNKVYWKCTGRPYRLLFSRKNLSCQKNF